MDLYQLLKRDTEAQARLQSYGIDPTRVETYLQDKRRAHADPTGDLACANADRDLARRRAAR